MRKRRITEIEIETRETFLIQWKGQWHRPQAEQTARPRCRLCGETEPMLTSDEAAALTGSSLRTVFRWVESETVHFTETADGRLYVCLNSLPSATGIKRPSQLNSESPDTATN
ncbi:MAG: hypothetical protein ABI977_11875 [Acidobacteriota bacterium]